MNSLQSHARRERVAGSSFNARRRRGGGTSQSFADLPHGAVVHSLPLLSFRGSDASIQGLTKTWAWCALVHDAAVLPRTVPDLPYVLSWSGRGRQVSAPARIRQRYAGIRCPRPHPRRTYASSGARMRQLTYLWPVA